MTRIVVALVLRFSAFASAQTPAPLFELPAPTGKSADRHHALGGHRLLARGDVRARTESATSKIIAWYPVAAAAGGPTAPYLRDGMEEVLSFARLAKLGDAFNGLAA